MFEARDKKHVAVENNAMADEVMLNRRAEDLLSEMTRQRLHAFDIYIATSNEHRAVIRRIILAAQQAFGLCDNRAEGIRAIMAYKANFDHEMQRYKRQNRFDQANVSQFLLDSERVFDAFHWSGMPLGTRQAYEHEVDAQHTFVYTLAQRHYTDIELEWPFPMW